jgi:hypothetical protein
MEAMVVVSNRLVGRARYPHGLLPFRFLTLLVIFLVKPGMPLWIAIASYGDQGSRQFLFDLGVKQGLPTRGASEDDDEVIGPCTRDYIISIFLIIFGVVASLCGVLSNIYVQIDDTFFNGDD